MTYRFTDTKMKKTITILAMAWAAFSRAQIPDEAKNLKAYIDRDMPKTVRVCTADTVGNFALPYPFSVPCIVNGFQNMFYWDTYFTNVGLLLDGNAGQAKNNIDNILAMIERFGYMPNATCEGMLNRSQPPYASMMVREVYEATRDKAWLARACKTLEKEYGFWMTRRMTPSGLNRYSNNADKASLMAFYNYIVGRLGLNPAHYTDDEERCAVASHFLAEAESGWDFNPRFDSRCEDHNPVDLNANLYAYERNFAYFYKELGLRGAKNWEKLAARRKALLDEMCLDPRDGLYYDYDYVNRRRSPVLSAAVFSTLFAKLAGKKQARAIYRNLSRLECANGVAACEKGDRRRVYQWDYPNGWAALNYLAIKGLDSYGYRKAARRIAVKYVHSMADIYKRTGNLWEKYNAVSGSTDVKDEYAMPGAFMGWTAGVYIFAFDYYYK